MSFVFSTGADPAGSNQATNDDDHHHDHNDHDYLNIFLNYVERVLRFFFGYIFSEGLLFAF